MCHREFPADRQAEAGAAFGTVVGRLKLLERLKNTVEVMFFYSTATILNLQSEPGPVLSRPKQDDRRSGKLERIACKVDQDLQAAASVGESDDVLTVDVYGHRAVAGEALELILNLTQKITDREGGTFELSVTEFDSAVIKDFVDQIQKVARGGADLAAIKLRPVRDLRSVQWPNVVGLSLFDVRQDPRISQNDRQRGAKLVA